MSLAFALQASRFRGITWGGMPDPDRVFVTIGGSKTVHEVDPRGPGAWGGIGSWSKHTLCGRRLHAYGQRGPQLAIKGPAFIGASCNGCRKHAPRIALLHALVRWGKAMARRQSSR